MQTSTTPFQTENRFAIASEKELIEAFRFRDQKKLVLPDGLKYPMSVRSYFTWREPSNTYTYLVFKKPNWDLPRGIAFKKVNRTGEAQGGGMCSWCHAYGSSDEIGMLSVAVNADTSFSYILCQDLRCIEKIEEASSRSGKAPDRMIELLYYRMGEMCEGISTYRPEP